MKKVNEKFVTKHLSNLILCLTLVVLTFSFLSSTMTKSLVVSNSEYKGTIYAGDKNSNKVTLMVNVYWGNESLVKMLDIFKKYNISTTFFVGGSWAKENEVLLKRIQNEGHEIASHGYSHKEHGKLSYEQNLAEIQKCHEVVKFVTGTDMNLFAPPGGSYNSSTTTAANFLGYKTIMWTRDTIDWRDHNTSLIYNRAVVEMCGGDLILMHPTQNTVEALTNIICYAQNHGFKLTTVSDNLGFNAQSST